MSKSVARQWLLKKAKPEYRFRVFNPLAKDYPSVLRSFRDGKLKLGSVEPLPDLGVKEDYRTAKMPPVNTSLLDGELAWRQHDGGHEDRSNMKYFIAWASKFLKHSIPAPSTAP